MTKNRTLTAILPDGTKIKRTTARTYTYVVVGLPDQERSRQLSDADYPADASNFRYYQKIIDTGVGGKVDLGHGFFSQPKTQDEIDSAIAERLGCRTAEEYVAKKRAERVARHDAAVAEGHFQRFMIIGWCGRLDLAQKLRASSDYRGVTNRLIIPVDA